MKRYSYLAKLWPKNGAAYFCWPILRNLCYDVHFSFFIFGPPLAKNGRGHHAPPNDLGPPTRSKIWPIEWILLVNNYLEIGLSKFLRVKPIPLKWTEKVTLILTKIVLIWNRLAGYWQQTVKVLCTYSFIGS